MPLPGDEDACLVVDGTMATEEPDADVVMVAAVCGCLLRCFWSYSMGTSLWYL